MNADQPGGDPALERLGQQKELYARALRDATRELEGKIHELGVLRQLGEMFAHATRVEDVIAQALPMFLQLAGAENASVMLRSAGTGELYLFGAQGSRQPGATCFGPEGHPARAFRAGEGMAGACAELGEPLVADEVAVEPRFLPRAGRVEPGSLMCLPLAARDEVRGVVNLSHPEPHGLRSDQLPICAILAGYLGIALSHAGMFRDLRAANQRLERRVGERTEALERANRELAEARTEVKRHNQELQARVEERTRELEQALTELRVQHERLVEANRVKDEFLNNINHELKTPLNAIIGYAGLLAKQAQALDDDQRADLQLIEANGKHLLQILENIFSLKDIESGSVQLDRVETDLNEVIRQTVASVLPRAREKGLDLAFEPQDLPLLPVDPTLFRRVLFNLLDNAVKFSQQGRVTVRSRRAHLNPAAPQIDLREGEGAGPFAVVEVQDQGRGIAPGDVDRIFQKFVQGEAAMRKTEGGSGVGLTIAKNLVELHGGRIWVTSRPGSGSTFGFCLPYPA